MPTGSPEKSFAKVFFKNIYTTMAICSINTKSNSKLTNTSELPGLTYNYKY